METDIAGGIESVIHQSAEESIATDLLSNAKPATLERLAMAVVRCVFVINGTIDVILIFSRGW